MVAATAKNQQLVVFVFLVIFGRVTPLCPRAQINIIRHACIGARAAAAAAADGPLRIRIVRRAQRRLHPPPPPDEAGVVLLLLVPAAAATAAASRPHAAEAASRRRRRRGFGSPPPPSAAAGLVVVVLVTAGLELRSRLHVDGDLRTGLDPPAAVVVGLVLAPARHEGPGPDPRPLRVVLLLIFGPDRDADVGREGGAPPGLVVVVVTVPELNPLLQGVKLLEPQFIKFRLGLGHFGAQLGQARPSLFFLFLWLLALICSLVASSASAGAGGAAPVPLLLLLPAEVVLMLLLLL